MKPLKKLRAKYGKLTVVSEETIDGRRTAIVNCKCGVQKRVLVDALTAGRTRSCGALACKSTHSRIKVSRTYSPRGSDAVPLPTLRKIWAKVHNTKSPITIAAAAKQFGIDKPQTLYSAIRAARRCGGIDEYAKRVKA